MDISFITVFKLLYFIYLFCMNFAATDDLGLCANPFCTEPIGRGVTIQAYNADEFGKLSFSPRQIVEIFVKDYGVKKNLIGVWFNGKRGFVPQTLVQETSTKVQRQNLVPALIRYGFEEKGVKDFASQELHASNQGIHNLIPNTVSYAEASTPHHKAFVESSIQPTETIVPNPKSFTGDASSQVHFPSSSSSSFDPQLGPLALQQTSLHFSHPHQHSSIPGDFHSSPNSNPTASILAESHQQASIAGDANTAYQQYGSDAANTGYQQYGSDMRNTAHQSVVLDASNTASQYVVPGVSDFAYQNVVPGDGHSVHKFAVSDASNTANQHNVPGVGNVAHQLYVSDVAQDAQKITGDISPSQNNVIPNTPNHPNVNVKQVMTQFTAQSMQFAAPQNDPLISGNFPNQQQFVPIQSSFPFQSFGSPLVSPFPPGSFSGESNYVSDYQQTVSPISNAAFEMKQSTDFVAGHQNFGKGSNDPVTDPYGMENSNELDSYEETLKLLKKQGYKTKELSQHYNLDVSSDNSNSISDQSQQNVNPTSGSINEPSHADSLVNTQTDTLKGSHSDLKSSYKSTTAELKADQPSDKTSDIVNQQTSHKTSDTVNQQTSNTFGIPSSEENPEEDFNLNSDEDDGKTDIEDETETEKQVNNLDVETVANDNMNEQSENMIGNNEQLKKKIIQTEERAKPPLSDILAKQSEHSADKTVLPHTNTDGRNYTRENLTHERNNKTEINSNIGSNIQVSDDIEFKENLSVPTETNNTKNNELNPRDVDADSAPLVDRMLKDETNVTVDVTGEENVEDFLFDSFKKLKDGGVTETNVTENEHSVLDEILKKAEEEGDQSNPYQIRNLKEDQESENVEVVDEMGENATYSEDDEYSIVNNSLEAIRLFISELMTWVPEPLYSTIMDLECKGLSPRVPVFTALCAVPCILLIIVVVYIQETSKERSLIVKLAYIEKNVFTLSAEKNALENKLEKTSAEFESTKNMLDEERKSFDSKKTEIISLKQVIEKANFELESNLEEISTLKEREKQYMELIKDHEKIHLDLMEDKSLVEKKLADDEDELNELSYQLKEKECQITILQTEVQKFKQSNEDCEEKLSQLQKNCNQLLKEAEVWNMRVNELNSKLSEESSAKEELQNSLELKDVEIKSLTHLVQTFKAFEEMESTNEDENTSNEEKLKLLLDSSSVLLKLQKQEDENKLLSVKLVAEKDKILEMEVELLESTSEVDKLKVNYNQALQDKAEATTKLEVLTNYFKDKELLLQKQLGAQEAFRERREKDADSAERQIVLIEQENASYKSQVASMKQEMEETERNLKSQIAAQEKKAHENWIAARAAERKLEDMKQETTLLQQRLTLLERQQENWVNSPRDDLIRPIPKRISGLNNESINGQDLNNSIDPRHMFHPPPSMMLPLDRPLPPLPPLPPFLAPLEPPLFRPPPPWHHQDPSFRMTSPDFMGPPRNRHSAVIDGDIGPMQSSPLGGSDMRDSPSHSLPDFHDIPPPPRHPFFPPPPGHHPRYPMPPQYSRRDYVPDNKRTDTQSDTSSVGHASQPPSLSQDNWSHNTRV